MVTVHAEDLEWEGTWQILDTGWEREIQVAIRDGSRGPHLQVASNKKFELEFKNNGKPLKGQGNHTIRLTFRASVCLSCGRRMRGECKRTWGDKWYRHNRSACERRCLDQERGWRKRSLYLRDRICRAQWWTRCGCVERARTPGGFLGYSWRTRQTMGQSWSNLLN